MAEGLLPLFHGSNTQQACAWMTPKHQILITPSCRFHRRDFPLTPCAVRCDSPNHKSIRGLNAAPCSTYFDSMYEMFSTLPSRFCMQSMATSSSAPMHCPVSCSVVCDVHHGCAVTFGSSSASLEAKKTRLEKSLHVVPGAYRGVGPNSVSVLSAMRVPSDFTDRWPRSPVESKVLPFPSNLMSFVLSASPPLSLSSSLALDDVESVMPSGEIRAPLGFPEPPFCWPEDPSTSRACEKRRDAVTLDCFQKYVNCTQVMCGRQAQ